MSEDKKFYKQKVLVMSENDNDNKPKSQENKKVRRRARLALRSDYYSLFREIIPNPRPDIFSGNMVFWSDAQQNFLPIDNTDFSRVKAVADDRETRGIEPTFKTGMVEHMFQLFMSDRFIKASGGELILDPGGKGTEGSGAYDDGAVDPIGGDLPEWDLQDRISEIAHMWEPVNISKEEFSELLKGWGATAFKRLADPQIDNRMLILCGVEGAGKDLTVKALTKALGQFVVPFVYQNQEKDILAAMGSGMVVHISEFDQTNKAEMAFLKFVVTASSTFFRASYDRLPKVRKSRWSFLCTSNFTNFLREDGENRRFVPVDMGQHKLSRENIQKLIDYPKKESLQILSQWFYYSRYGFKVREETETKMREYVKTLAPDSRDDSLVEDYLALVKGKPGSFLEHHGEMKLLNGFTIPDLEDVFQILARQHRLSEQTIKHILKQKGLQRRWGAGRFYLRALGTEAVDSAGGADDSMVTSVSETTVTESEEPKTEELLKKYNF